MTLVIKRTLLACLAVVGGASIAPDRIAQAQEVIVKVGTVRSISTATILWAAEKGYFKEYGIKVVTETLDTAANSIALLAQNQLQLVEGRDLGRLFQRAGEEPAHHHGARPGVEPDRAQPDAAPRPQGPDHAAAPAQGQDHRHQRAGRGVDL